ncbi:hypothetical protein BRW65_01680 [Mycobacterium paraffinicum]|uniref:Acyl-CoA dehydrogenase n=2 Tax=Mycobacterium paraffinicum TaxID=53378 RepID=A0A1Q4I323_9MYCO|nr:hypothetical protein BRW65_01680 [Mycobacterium paraffinicum]
MSAEQALLRDSTVGFIDEVCPLPRLREYATGATPMPPDYLRRAAELGWFSMLVPAEYGGGCVSDDGLVDAALLAELRGAQVQPGPFVPMNVVAHALGRRGGGHHTAEVLPEIVSGRHVAVWAVSDPESASAGTGGVVGTAVDGGYRLTGTKAFVQDPIDADSFLLDVVIDGELRQVLLDAHAGGVTVRPLESLDFSLRMGRVQLDGAQVAEADFVGTAETTPADLSTQIDVAAVLCVAETVGAMNRLFEMTVQYAKDRIAFGRPIGSFQAVKHQLADLSLLLEMSKASVEAAVKAVADALREQNASGGASMIASTAKAFVGDAANQISQGCFQVFGGIGFTWEHDLHLYLRRASVNEVLYGTPTWHRERIVRLGGQ